MGGAPNPTIAAPPTIPSTTLLFLEQGARSSVTYEEGGGGAFSPRSRRIM
jgi:hypothetical protein